tara:strand:+ start:4993 stop:5181 length:189 start_codon:yes stop_codon:yes gene_type:complete
MPTKAENLRQAIVDLIDEKISTANADSGDSCAGMGEWKKEEKLEKAICAITGEKPPSYMEDD